MFRFLALLWDSADPRQAAAAEAMLRRLKSSGTAWREALGRTGLRVFYVDARGSLQSQPLPDGQGVVLGALFARDRDLAGAAPSIPAVLSAKQTAATIESRGDWLVHQCWGNYVAFFAGSRPGNWCVLKDPTGSLPCFTTCASGVTIVFSAAADTLELGELRFTIDFQRLKWHLYGDEISRQDPPLNDVTQVRRGECVEVDPRQQPAIVHRRLCWHPLHFAQADQLIDDPMQAARLLRNTLRACTWSWAACHDSLLLRLSGGLDSSIVLGCLKGAPTRPQLLSYTQYTPDGISDPRRWARMAAEHARCEQVECAVTAADIQLRSLLDAAPATEPVSTMMRLVTAPIEQQLTVRSAATATFSGDGGDCVFGSLCVGEVVPAYLRRHGFGLRALRLAGESATVLRQTAWTMLARGIRAWLTGRSHTTFYSINNEGRKLLAADVIRECAEARDASSHPWVGPLERASWEILSKLGVLLGTPELYDGVSRPDADHPELIAPIYSQPMVEACLRIPADLLFLEGRDRGLARRAFMSDVPDAILNRTWKDRAGTFHDEIVRGHLDWLRELFLDGVLVAEGLLDRQAVEQALSPRLTRNGVFAGEVLRHLDTEIWAQQWLSRRAVGGVDQ